MQAGVGVVLGAIIALLLSLGSCAGVDTSQIEQYANSLGIGPVEVPFEGMTGEDDMDAEIGWKYAESAEECAEGAGFATFPALEDLGLDLGEPSVSYYYQDGHAQAFYIATDLAVFVDKALYTGVDDISMDDRPFNLEWTETIEGVDVDCFGDQEGMVCKAIFANGDCVYSITAFGPDDDLNRGLSSEDLAILVTALL